MKRTLTLLVLISLVATPALAYGQQAVSPDAENMVTATRLVETEPLISAETLAALVATAADEVVSADSSGLAPAAPQGADGMWGSGSRIAIGIAMIAGGAAIVWKGTDVWQDEPDRFGRTKNSDAYLAWGVGGTIMAFGGMVLRGGLQGRSFQ